MKGNPIIFCDWIKVKQEHIKPHKPFGAVRIDIDPDTGVGSRKMRFIPVKGEFESSVFVRSDGYTVEFDGNPSRWNRENNIQGIDLDQAKQVVNQIVTDLGLPPFSSEYQITPEGRQYTGARITRLDITTNLKMGSPNKAALYQRWIQTQEYPRLDKLIYGTTTYFGRDSQTRTLRIYDKAREFFDKKKCPEAAERLHRNGVVRYEMEYRKYLRKKGFSMWHNATAAATENQFIQDIEHMTREIEAIDIDDLPANVLGTYLMYQEGINPKRKLSKNTFYSHRKILLAYGIDISNMTVERMPQPVVVVEPEAYNDDQQELKLG